MMKIGELPTSLFIQQVMECKTQVNFCGFGISKRLLGIQRSCEASGWLELVVRNNSPIIVLRGGETILYVLSLVTISIS